METTVEITSHFLKALCNSSFFVISQDRYGNKIFHLSEYSHPSINQEDRFYGSCRNSSLGSKSEWKIRTQSVKRLPNSNLISGEVFTRGRRPNDNDALKWLIFVEAPQIVVRSRVRLPNERLIFLFAPLYRDPGIFSVLQYH